VGYFIVLEARKGIEIACRNLTRCVYCHTNFFMATYKLLNSGVGLRMSYRRKAVRGGLIVISLALSGCITTFSDVTSGDAATMHFSNGTYRKMSLFIYDDAAECMGRRVLKPLLGPGEERKLVVPANRELALTFANSLDYHTRCNGTFSFTPLAGKTYEIQTRLESDQCTQYQVLERADGEGRSGAVHPVTVHLRKWKHPVMEASPSCEPGVLPTTSADTPGNN
jgi:hypothetical protein